MLWIKHGKIWQCVPDTHLQNTEPSSSVPHGVGKRWSYIYTTMQRRCSQNIPMIHLGYWVRNRKRLLFCRWHFKCIFLNGKYFSLIQISLKCVAKSPIDNKAELVQVIFDAKKSFIIWTNIVQDPWYHTAWWHDFLNNRHNGVVLI